MTMDPRDIVISMRAAWTIATEAKDRVPCSDCGVAYRYWVMQHDHVPDRGEKSFTVALTYTGGPRRVRVTRVALLAEIAKCEVVCANCHAERTHSRGGQRWGPPIVAALDEAAAEATP